jgi:methylated-DNA-[protein]-cysteine S-methyltransferase
LSSPVGELKLVASRAGLVAVLWENDDPRRVRLDESTEDDAHPILARAETELAEYFAWKRNSFSIPLEARGTVFQKQVWEALLGIPFGETRCYGEIATQLGVPTASRAVGGANGRNPISIIVPCHRVIGSSGKLTGFAGGLEAKSFLLNLEGKGRDVGNTDVVNETRRPRRRNRSGTGSTVILEQFDRRRSPVDCT